jgi:GDP-L-fucose synthase
MEVAARFEERMNPTSSSNSINITMIDKKSRIYIAGHRGMVGASIQREFESRGYQSLISASHSELDLLQQSTVDKFFKDMRPEYVVIAAARVGGIQANIDRPASFLYENLQIQNNLIHCSHLYSVKKVCFLGSSCIYPRNCPQPMREEHLLDGPLEPTNEGYAIAKIAGIRLCQFYGKQYGLKSVSLIPCNLYGRNDSFNLAHSHVLSALVKRFVDATLANADSVTLWGTGIARREFLNVDDFSRMAVSLFESRESSEIINVGSGADISIAELAQLISKTVGYRGTIAWDHSKPDGMLRKCMDVSKLLALGIEPTTSLEQGVSEMVEMYRQAKKGASE